MRRSLSTVRRHRTDFFGYTLLLHFQLLHFWLPLAVIIFFCLFLLLGSGTRCHQKEVLASALQDRAHSAPKIWDLQLFSEMTL